jgi:hypothetical protein
MNEYDELRKLIANCCDEAASASKVALQTLRAVEREGKRRRDQMRELRSRLTTIEAMLRGGRAR